MEFLTAFRRRWMSLCLIKCIVGDRYAEMSDKLALASTTYIMTELLQKKMQSGQVDNGQYASDGDSSGSPTGTGIREFGYPDNPQSGIQGFHRLQNIDK